MLIVEKSVESVENPAAPFRSNFCKVCRLAGREDRRES